MKLSRVTQKIFGSTAGSTQIAQFGSLAAGSPVLTTNPTTIQALSNYLQGWFGATLGGNSPAIQDLNAIHYLDSYQLAYLFQQGIPEYDGSTTYFQYSAVQSGGSVYYASYGSASGFSGQAVTNGSYWTATVAYIPSHGGITGSNIASTTTITCDTLTTTTLLKTNGQLQLGSTSIAEYESGISLATDAPYFTINSSIGAGALDGSYGEKALGIKNVVGSDTYPIVVSIAPASNSLLIVRGAVNSGGAKVGGEGFTSGISGDVYTVTFTTAFGDTPIITITSTHASTGGCVATILTSAPGSFTCQSTTPASADTGFNFIAIGQRP